MSRDTQWGLRDPHLAAAFNGEDYLDFEDPLSSSSLPLHSAVKDDDEEPSVASSCSVLKSHLALIGGHLSYIWLGFVLWSLLLELLRTINQLNAVERRLNLLTLCPLLFVFSPCLLGWAKAQIWVNKRLPQVVFLSSSS